MREPKITLAYIRGWDHFDMNRYSNYLKAIQNVENTLSRLHWRSLEDIRKDNSSRYRMGGQEDEQPLGKVNN
jgi:hypothetical protein